jgi:hypothetical protein
MGANISQFQAQYDMGFPNAEEFRRACEKGRLLAASVVATDPIKRQEMEARFGKEHCMKRWPEAYLGR